MRQVILEVKHIYIRHTDIYDYTYMRLRASGKECLAVYEYKCCYWTPQLGG
jgi:hypothetical protein